MSVPFISVIFMALNILVGLAIPIGLFLFLKKKYDCSTMAFWVGAGIMFLFALVLEQIVHAAVLSSPAGAVIQGNFWILALYGGFMAGLFEETGRFVAMKFLLKKKQANDYNAIMYGAGHGGFEACYILVIGMINNLLYSIMINSGNVQMLMTGLDAANQAVVQQAVDSLVATSPFLFLVSPLERMAAVVAQLSLSVLVWFAAKNTGSFKWYPIAIFLHFMLDFVAAALNGMGVAIMVIELVVWIMAIAFAVFAKKLWSKERNMG